MMALAFKTKKAAQLALAEKGFLNEDDIIETSFFGREYRDGEHSVVVSTQPDRVRNSFGRITVRGGLIVKVV